MASVLAAGASAIPARALAKGDPWSPRALAGPFTSIEAWCRRQPTSDRCQPAGESAATHVELAAPLLDGRWLVTGDPEGKTARLALRTQAGWFVSAPVEDPGLFVRPGELLMRSGTPPLLAATVVTTWNASDDPEGNGRWQLHCQENQLLCGVGPSGRPSCTPGIPKRDGACEDPDQAFDWSYSLEVTVRPDGVLEIAAPAGAKLTANARRAVGRHRLPLR